MFFPQKQKRKKKKEEGNYLRTQKYVLNSNSIDHCPLMLNLNPNMGNVFDRPFGFQSIWLNHEEFPTVVRAAWEGQDVRLKGAILDFTVKAQRWNKEVFGNVFAKKNLIMAKLVGIQKALASRPNPFLINL